MSDEQVLFSKRGACGHIVLNRPDAMNALTIDMVRSMTAALYAWERDPSVLYVTVRGTPTASGRPAFCAGGDIRALYDLGKAENYNEQLSFWREEYQLNARIASYSKPYIALIDGIVMGGGVGISLHGSHRVAGDHFAFAMPEVGIGFFPDVGASYFLPRLPGMTGTFLAMTGGRIKSTDALELGLITQHVPTARWSELLGLLEKGAPIGTTLENFKVEPAEPGDIMSQRPLIDTCFGRPTVGDILRALSEAASAGSEFAKVTLDTILLKSPSSICIAHQQMLKGKDMSFEEAMKMEFRIVSHLCKEHDFYEGVRALLIDKDNAPVWQPDWKGKITPASIETYFANIGAYELTFPKTGQG